MAYGSANTSLLDDRSDIFIMTIGTFSASAADFYTLGASSFLLIRPFFNELSELIDNEVFVENTFTGVKNVVKWSKFADSSAVKGLDKRLENKKNYLSMLQQYLNSPVLGGLNGLYDVEVVDVDCWNGSQDLNWHWDGVEKKFYDVGGGRHYSNAFILIYFSDHDTLTWDPDFGGSFLYATRHLDDKTSPGLVEEDLKLVNQQEVFPINRQAVLVNNANPMFVHRTTKMPRLADGSARKRIVLQAELYLRPKA